jgi:uncharacterized protein (DUF305 family)
MKKILLASFTSILFACNSKTDSHNATHDTSDHAMQNHSSNPMKQENQMTAMHAAMNQMMQQMHNTQPTGDADYDFAVLMKIHHQSAVDMARTLIEGGTDPAIKQHAQHTIDEQQKEIAAFDKFLHFNKPTDSSSDYGQKAMKMMSHMQDDQMEAGSLEKMYASMMIPHHQDGVKMAEEYLKVANNAELKKIAQGIIQTQPKEIEDYKKWLE